MRSAEIRERWQRMRAHEDEAFQGTFVSPGVTRLPHPSHRPDIRSTLGGQGLYSQERGT